MHRLSAASPLRHALTTAVLPALLVLSSPSALAESITTQELVYEKGWRHGAEIGCLSQLGTLAAAKRAAYKDAAPEEQARAELEAQLFEDLKDGCGEHADWLWRKMKEKSR